MPTDEGFTITLPAEVVRDIDRLEKNWSKFVLDAVCYELQRRTSEERLRSLRGLRAESAQLGDVGSELDLVDLKAGTPVRWIPGEGWVEVNK